MWATCHTEDCFNSGIPIDVGELSYVDEETGETQTIDTVYCGPCRQPITDLSETQPPMPPDPDEGLVT